MPLPDELLSTPYLRDFMNQELTWDGAELIRPATPNLDIGGHETLAPRRKNAVPRLEQGYAFLRLRANNKVSVRTCGIFLGLADRHYLTLLLVALNRQISHGGAWVVALVNDGQKVVCVWLDRDGDARLTVEIPYSEYIYPPLLNRGDTAWADHWVTQCGDAMWAHFEIERDMEVSPLERHTPAKRSIGWT